MPKKALQSNPALTQHPRQASAKIRGSVIGCNDKRTIPPRGCATSSYSPTSTYLLLGQQEAVG